MSIVLIDGIPTDVGNGADEIIKLRAENTRLREELAAAQATIEQMREALTEVVDADECQDADGWLCFELSAEAYHRADAALSIPANIDALHEALAKECERLAKKRRLLGDSSTALLLDIEAAAHRARKEEK